LKAKDAINLTPANWLKARSGQVVRKVGGEMAAMDAENMPPMHLPLR
jgi:hypothetical protein